MKSRFWSRVAAIALSGACALLSLVAPSALAVAPVVKTVPWVAGNPLIPHDTFAGKAVRLKGTADIQGTGITYIWDFGDGTPVATGTVSNLRAIEATHTYAGSVGTVYTARLTVQNTNIAPPNTASSLYFVKMQAKSLPVEVNVAIDEGLWFLHKDMTVLANNQGSWAHQYNTETPANLNAFFVNGHLESGAASNPYTETVQRGMRRLFSLLSTQGISSSKTYPAPIGTVNPDSNGNGLAVNTPDTNTYSGGIFIDAIVASGTPEAIATTGPTNVVGRKYKDIVQDMVDGYAFGQTASGTWMGGWGYGWNSGSSDNSVNQWAAIGMLAAEGWGGTVIVPAFVKTANRNSLNNTQATTASCGAALNGVFGYTSACGLGWGPYATTASGMVQMVFDGIGRGNAQWDRTENYIRNNFCNTGNSTQTIRDYYYGLFSLTKAMLLTPGSELQFLSNQPGNTNPLDWYAAEASAGAQCDGVARVLVNGQLTAGNWGQHNASSSAHNSFTTAWAIIMLGRTVFESGLPVAVAQAVPNPAVVGQMVHLDGSGSFHQDASRTIVSWEWDLNNDGVYDVSGVEASTSFPALGSYPIRLRVSDNSDPPKTAVSTVTVVVSIPPLAPTAKAGGPYNFCQGPGRNWFLDGTGSVNPDDGQHEAGRPGDFIKEYAWDLLGRGTFGDAFGATPNVTGFWAPGSYLIQLRVTDTTASSFPSSGKPDQSSVDATEVNVRAASDTACNCIGNLAARPKLTEVQLTWTGQAGTHHYHIYRGPQAGGPYARIGTTASTYSTYLDLNLPSPVGSSYYYVVRPASLANEELCQSNEAKGTTTTRGTPQAPVPNVVGLMQAAAVTAINSAGLTLGVVTQQSSATVPQGNVISQSPGASTLVNVGSAVNLVVSSGPLQVAVPNVVGMAQAAAQTAITTAGLVLGPVTQQSSATVPAGSVISQSPLANTLVGLGSAVSLVLSSGPAQVSVPNVVGLTQAVASNAITNANLMVGTVTQQSSPTVPAGTVISQSPVANTPVSEGSAVNLVVSSGVAQVQVPNVVGMTQPAAATAIINAGLVVGTVTQQSSTTVAQGSVISQSPVASTLVNVGSAVNLVISSGPAQVPVPNVVGLTQANAQAAIVAAQLAVGTITQQASATVPAGNVISQNPAASTMVNAGSAVDLVVSSGPAPQVQVPNVVGLTQAAATTAITNANLIVGTVTQQSSATVTAGNVISQNPVASTMVNAGSAVDLVVSSGPAPQVQVPNVVGLTQAAATTAITTAGLVVGTVTQQSSMTVPAGNVISQNPVATTLVNAGSAVSLVVSSGPPVGQVQVPNVVGQTPAAAQSTLIDTQLVPGNVTIVDADEELAFNSLPSAQDWFYGAFGNSALETSVFSLSNGVLTMNTLGLGTAGAGLNLYQRFDVAEAGKPFALTITARVLAQEGDPTDAFGFAFGFSSSTEQIAIGLRTNRIVDASGNTLSSTIDATQFHEYRLEGTPGLGYRLFVDGVLLGSGTNQPRTATGPTFLFVGDASGTANARAEITSLSFVQHAGLVIAQSPAAGTSVLVGSTVGLTAVRAPATISVPNVVGQAQSAAVATIVGAELLVGTLTTQQSSTVPAGSVISQTPGAGTAVAEFAVVSLVVSSGQGQGQVQVPNVVGLTQAAATTAIANAGLVLGAVTQQSSATVPAGNVISQNPAANTSVNASSAVNLVVSSGPGQGQVQVPNVVGLTQAAAIAAITNAGLVVGSVTLAASETVPMGSVISTTPAALASAPAGSAVDLSVSSGPTPATITSIVITPSNPLILTGQTQAFTATGILSNGTSLPLTIGLVWTSTNPGAASINAAGVASALAAGNTTISVAQGSVSGSTGLGVSASVTDPTAPVAQITSPANGATVTTIVPVVGTANDANFLKYVLEIATAGTTTFSPLAVGSAPVVNGTLGTLDPTVLINDQYTIRLTVLDRGGNQTSTNIGLQVTRDEKVGKFTLAFEDLAIPLVGIPIAIDRVYDSRDKAVGDFGFGWRLDLQSLRLRVNREQGSAWSVSRSGGILPTYSLAATDQHKVSITLPDGKVEEFDLTISPPSSFVLPLQFVTASYTARAGTQGTLQALDNNNLVVIGAQPGTVTLVDDFDFFTVYNPRSFLYTSANGRQFVIDRVTGLQSVTDPNGNRLTIGPTGIIHSSGKSISFTRDAQGRITQITDPKGGVIRYSYDVNGDLASHTDALGSVTRFFYNLSHGLIEVRDPLGRRGIRNEYDDQGRLVAIVDARGHRQEYTHNIGSRQEIITDRLGHTSVLNYDDKGNIVSETNALGGTTTRTFNASGKVLTEADPLGHTTTSTYDAKDNVLSKTDPLGNVTRYTYNDRNQATSVIDARGSITSYTYDNRGNVLTMTDPLGRVTTNTVDANGNRLTTVDAAGTNFQYQYDTGGNRTRYTDALGTVTNYAYDANSKKTSESMTRTVAGGGTVSVTTLYAYDAKNRLIRTTDALGNVTQTVYDAAGKEAATIDKLGRRTDKAYDEVGRLARVTYSDGTSEAFSYDAEGNLVASTDPLGRTTRFEYDALKRQIKTIYPDGSDSTKTYDAGGRLTAEKDENGNVTSYGYDAAGRRTSRTDALGKITSYTYDANGNQTSATDANSRTTQFEYDRNNRKTRTQHADASVSTVTYDGVGRKTSETDQAGSTTQNQYDALGRLVKVIDALGQETRYAYDEMGNKISQTDAAGNVTRWEYDSLGQVTRHILPLGMSESFSYDANGNMLTRTDFNGQTTRYAYDGTTRERNRVVSKSYPSGPGVSYTYTATGRIATATDGAGTTAYAYDARDRLAQVTNPDGTSLSYTYDAHGNRMNVTVGSRATSYAYDGLNRLVGVTDPGSGTTAYTFDNVGNRTSISHPNGTGTQYVYDALNRLVSLTNQGPGSSVLSSHSYTLGPAGNRVAVTENGGRSVSYFYDALRRMLGETITDPVAGNANLTYTYDAVGNRTSKSANGVVTTLVYDANNRLLQDGATSYTYDGNGNPLTKMTSGVTTAMTYDFENRLVSEAGPAGSHSYAYEHDGIRRSAVHDGVLARYVVDKNRDFAQVLEERNSSDTVVVSYVRGDDLISQDRSGERSFYHSDGTATTRLLTNGAGTATDKYSVDAWGNVLSVTGTTPNNYLYAGEQRDPSTGRYYLRARYYVPAVGRFHTSDPAEGNDFDPLSLHKYLYANGDPLNRRDPSGLQTMGELSISINISGTLSTLALNGLRMGLLLKEIGIVVGQAAVAACALSGTVSAFTAVGSGNLCDVTKYNVLYPDLRHPVTTGHIATAISFGFPPNLHRRQPPVRGARYFPGSPCGATSTPGNACDEYPFASVQEGFPNSISLMLTPGWESPVQGGTLGAFYGACNVIPNDPWDGAFGVVPTFGLLAVPWVCK